MFTISKQTPKRGVWRVEGLSPEPPRWGEIAVSVRMAGICGTDYHIFTWDAWSASRVPLPLTIGHEFVGVISAVGPGVKHLQVGQRVSAECHIACGVCVQCRTGNAHVCGAVSIIGVDRPGCFTERVVLPATNAWPVPDIIPDRHAAIFDPIGNAMHAVQEARVAGQDTLVIGGGPIGLFAAAIARGYGARSVIVQEPNLYRAALARSIGADLVVDPKRPDAAATIIAATGGGPAVVMEMSGNPAAIAMALQTARSGARVALMGLPSRPVELDLAATVIMKGLQLIGVTGRRMFDTWYQTEAFLLKHASVVDRIITHILPAAQYSEGFRLMDEGQCGKVVLDFTDIGRAAT